MRNLRSASITGSVTLLASLILIPWGVSEEHAGLGLHGASRAPEPAVDDLQSRVRTLVASKNVEADGFGSLSVKCPQGTVALGGGVNVSLVHFMKIFSTGPTVNGTRLMSTADGTRGAPDGWFGGIYNGDIFSRPFKVAAICAPLSGVTTVVASNSVNPGAFWSFSVACPAGKIAVGGGVDVEDHLFMLVTSSSPTVGGSNLVALADGNHGAPNGWYGAVRNDSAATKTFKVGVVCQPLKGITTVISSMVVQGGTSISETEHAQCPKGSIAVGGGIDAEDLFRLLSSETAPVFGTTYTSLMQMDNGVNPAPTGWQASAINGDESNRMLKVGAICAQWPLEFLKMDDASPPED